MSPRRLIGILAVVLAAAIAVASAAANPVPGATYTGVASDGAQVKFTVSPDGTLVTSMTLVNVQGDTCSFFTNDQSPGWPGAPIAQDAFDYRASSSGAVVTRTKFQGAFPGAQSASGTFNIHQDSTGPPTSTSTSPACDTGTVSWTARTTSTPPAPGSGAPGSGNGGSGGPGSGGSGPVGGGQHPTFVSRLRLRRLSRTRLGGRIRSPSGACRGRRTIILWRGSRRIASTTSNANGSFSFPRSAAVRGRRVRVSSPWLGVSGGTCAAASSTFITA